jgi:hypothetical protein
MKKKFNGVLNEAWITVLVSIDISLFVNVISAFELNRLKVSQLLLTLAATSLLGMHLEKRSIILDEIKGDIERNKIPYDQIDALHNTYLKKVPWYLKRLMIFLISFITIIFVLLATAGIVKF